MGYMKIVYRKGSDNDFDALSRREDLEDQRKKAFLTTPFLKINLTMLYLTVMVTQKILSL
jgi:hypothetical protein